MPGARLSSRAAADLAEIAEFTIESFGIEQAYRYKKGLEECFRRFTENPELGQSAEELASGLKRYPYKSHMVFYTVDEHGVLIVRVLHQSMDYGRYL